MRNLLDAVAPGGTLLVVNHDPEPMRDPSDPEHSRPIGPDAYVSVDEFVAELAASTDWEIEIHEKRPRLVGNPSPHIDDIVLRARRLTD